MRFVKIRIQRACVLSLKLERTREARVDKFRFSFLYTVLYFENFLYSSIYKPHLALFFGVIPFSHSPWRHNLQFIFSLTLWLQ